MTAAETFYAGSYGPAVERILAGAEGGERLAPLITGEGGIAVPDALRGATPQQLFPSSRAPEAALAGLMLYFDRADEAHAMVQDLATSEGSFWHGILHRREPDTGNSAYWFRRTGAHAVFPALAARAQKILSAIPDAGFVCLERWDPFAFIDFCEAVRRNPHSSGHRAALEIQRAEWQILFDFCARAAR